MADLTARSTDGTAPSMTDRPLRELRGVVERITFQNPDNGYTIARLALKRVGAEAEVAKGDDRLVTIVGTLANLSPGEAIGVRGWWRKRPRAWLAVPGR